mmetsp:Transcript_6758/g.10689  ORF Transcript_6758/g.10689 Transcript_6758/m.10689 type:complete len:192 (-) Transcript_6758:1062-1637(-)
MSLAGMGNWEQFAICALAAGVLCRQMIKAKDCECARMPRKSGLKGPVHVRHVEAGDWDKWKRLWKAYLIFYKEDLPEASTRKTWERITDPKSKVGCLGAFQSGEMVGFSVFVTMPSSWEINDICYLEDLFVDATARRQGVAKTLINALKEKCKVNKWPRLYWSTTETNYKARSVYDSLAKRTEYIQYRINI